MNRLTRFVLSAAVAVPLCSMSGCVHHRYSGEIVYEEPPAERVEIRGVAPSRDHIWIKGHYIRRGREWVWEPGRWELHHGRGEYVAGHWEREGRGWVYI